MGLNPYSLGPINVTQGWGGMIAVSNQRAIVQIIHIARGAILLNVDFRGVQVRMYREKALFDQVRLPRLGDADGHVRLAHAQI